MNTCKKISLFFTLIVLSGCSGTSPNITKVKNPTTRDKPICYAHMLKGEKYLKCTPKPTPKTNNIEILRFYDPTNVYPNYNFSGKAMYNESCTNVKVLTVINKETRLKKEKRKENVTAIIIKV